MHATRTAAAIGFQGRERCMLIGEIRSLPVPAKFVVASLPPRRAEVNA
jgi:hypothetical protein